MKVAGIDPGTKSFDIVVIEDNKVIHESSFETKLIAEKPLVLVEELEKSSVDYVVAPSGYGVPVHRGIDVRNPWRFAVEVLLLSSNDQLERGIKKGDPGIWVYRALASLVVELIERYKEKVFFIPGVIHLPTIPVHRKINRVDMGTADKLSATFLSVYELTVDRGIPLEELSFILLELGYGYYAVIGVNKGQIVDAIGGTSASTGTLTAGSLDLELVAGVENWERWDVFHGGILDYTGVLDFDLFTKRAVSGEEPYTTLLEHYVEGVLKDIEKIKCSVPRSELLVLTGRHSKNSTLVKLITERLRDTETTRLRGLRGASIAKEAAQGYALLGLGLTGNSEVSGIVSYMEINRACGTCVDYIIHPKGRDFKNRVVRAYLESVINPRLCRGYKWL